jgi:ribosome biogenesis SPOUT family RNA methylase Rps3
MQPFRTDSFFVMVFGGVVGNHSTKHHHKKTIVNIKPAFQLRNDENTEGYGTV